MQEVRWKTAKTRLNYHFLCCVFDHFIIIHLKKQRLNRVLGVLSFITSKHSPTQGPRGQRVWHLAGRNQWAETNDDVFEEPVSAPPARERERERQKARVQSVTSGYSRLAESPAASRRAADQVALTRNAELPP